MEVRMDDGLVITWGDNTSGKLGVKGSQNQGF